MTEQLSRILLRLQVERKTETLRRGWAAFPSWVFCTEAGTPLDESRVRKVLTKSLGASGLPLHFSPLCLRHTFASLLLQARREPGLRSAPARARLHPAGPSTPKASGCRWATRRPSTGSTTRVV